MLVSSVNSSTSCKNLKSTNGNMPRNFRFEPSIATSACDTLVMRKAPSTIGHSVRSAIAGVCLGLATLFGASGCDSVINFQSDQMTVKKALLNIAETLDPSAASNLSKVEEVSFMLDDGSDVLPMELKFDYRGDDEALTECLTVFKGNGSSLILDVAGESRLSDDGGVVYESFSDPCHDIKFNVVDDAVQVQIIDNVTDTLSDVYLLKRGRFIDTAVLRNVIDRSKISYISQIAFNDAAELAIRAVANTVKSIK